MTEETHSASGGIVTDALKRKRDQKAQRAMSRLPEVPKSIAQLAAEHKADFLAWHDVEPMSAGRATASDSTRAPRTVLATQPGLGGQPHAVGAPVFGPETDADHNEYIQISGTDGSEDYIQVDLEQNETDFAI